MPTPIAPRPWRQRTAIRSADSVDQLIDLLVYELTDDEHRLARPTHGTHRSQWPTREDQPR